MTDMVERVARASFAFWKQQNSRVADFEDMNPDELEFAMAHASAMIEVMQEPTDAMIQIVYDTCHKVKSAADDSNIDFLPDAWRALVAAARRRNESET